MSALDDFDPGEEKNAYMEMRLDDDEDNHDDLRQKTTSNISNDPNEKTPVGVSSSEKVLYSNDSINDLVSKYDVRHPKPSISRNTARKMLLRDLTAYLKQECDRARIDELEDMNYRAAAENWHKDREYKLWMHVSDRLKDLNQGGEDDS